MNSKIPTVILPIKREWFDMILIGEKQTEYREYKPYWEKRILDKAKDGHIYAVFKNGYGENMPTLKAYCRVEVRKGGFPEWGAEPKKKYICLDIIYRDVGDGIFKGKSDEYRAELLLKEIHGSKNKEDI